MKLIIHRGSNQIGGNCVEVSTERTRLILDVGMPLTDLADRKQTRPKNLPVVPGLFDEGPRVDAVLISHAHGDHTGFLKWIRPEIPVYLSKGTSKMLMAGSIFAGQHNPPPSCQSNLEPNKPKRIGDITVTGFSVDHSAFDSLALLLEADGKRILYSGDLRLHGRKQGMARQLIAHIQKNPVDVLVMEGTSLSRTHEPPQQTEDELVETLTNEIRDCPGLVLASFSPQHIDRFVSFYKATRKAGREFVADAYGAFVWHLASGQIKIPKLSSKAGLHTYFNQSFEWSWRSKKPQICRPIGKNRIELSAILENPKRFVMLYRPSMTDLNFKNAVLRYATCIYSFWPGYLVQPEYRALKIKLAEAEGKFVQCHTSGHIFADDIVKFVNAINPRRVVPIHTEAPERFQSFFKNTLLLKDGIPLII